MDIRRRMKFFMYFHDLNQSELASATGLGQTNIHRWLNGKAEPSLYMLKTMAYCCGVSVSSFIAQGEIELDEIASTSRPVLRRVSTNA
jgi:transcriptional regulator with XRE-family HTH domain